MEHVNYLDVRTRIRRVAMVLLVGQTIGCWGGLGRVAPAGLEPMSRADVQAWVTELSPNTARRYDLTWAFRTQQGGVRGRAAVRFAPPDSIRFDYRGPFGRSGAAVVVGDSVVWAEPEEDASQLIPVAPLFWAALGIPRDPPVGAEVYGRELADGRAWQYVTAGDTLSYVVSRASGYRLEAEMRRRGRVLGLVELQYADSAVTPRQAVVTFPATAAIMQFTVEGVEDLESVDPDVWKRPG